MTFEYVLNAIIVMGLIVFFNDGETIKKEIKKQQVLKAKKNSVGVIGIINLIPLIAFVYYKSMR